jgi:hypothetical protein
MIERTEFYYACAKEQEETYETIFNSITLKPRVDSLFKKINEMK